MNEVRSPWHFDRAAALVRLDDDEDLLRDIIQQFVSDAPASLSAIEAAIQQGDAPALRDAAHALKGAAGYLAADDLCVAAQELEGFGRSCQVEAARSAWPRFAALAHEVLTTLRANLPGA
ncbi:MAG: Hpt domain-containing protein [Acidobacteria bacterium]|nr:Hpt domain-containing protein [Acidobacteriota bacterium]